LYNITVTSVSYVHVRLGSFSKDIQLSQVILTTKTNNPSTDSFLFVVGWLSF